MTREALWRIAVEKALLDRQDFLAAHEGCDEDQIALAQSEVDTVSALRGKSLRDALAANREGVRLVLLSAELWYRSLADAQIGKESRSAYSVFKQVHAWRLQEFGRTRLEVALSNATAVPLREVPELLKRV